MYSIYLQKIENFKKILRAQRNDVAVFLWPARWSQRETHGSVQGSLRKISQWYPARRSNIISPRKDSDESTGPGLFNDVCISGARRYKSKQGGARRLRRDERRKNESRYFTLGMRVLYGQHTIKKIQLYEQVDCMFVYLSIFVSKLRINDKGLKRADLSHPKVSFPLHSLILLYICLFSLYLQVRTFTFTLQVKANHQHFK